MTEKHTLINTTIRTKTPVKRQETREKREREYVNFIFNLEISRHSL